MQPVFVVFIGLLGAIIGSFANVVIWRLPRRESIVFPGSHCPHCGHKLGVLDLVPVLSWLFLRGRCRYCKAPISWPYPLVEGIMATGFVCLAWRFPPEVFGLTVMPLLALYAMLVMMSAIDLDHHILPDSLTLPAILVGTVGSLLYDPASGLPGLAEAIFGGALAAGIVVLINRSGSLVLRRLADTKERLWPLGMDQVNLAALGGVLGGWAVGLGLAALSVAVNLISRKTLRVPEGPLYALWLLLLMASSLNLTVDLITTLSGTLVAAGAVAILGAGYWWLHDIAKREATTVPPAAEDDEPIAMGFGDVKLAAILGLMLGWQNLLFALLLSFFLGAIGGLIARALGGGRQVPFGPYLALGGLIALFFGPGIIDWYLGFLT